jgi:putative acetyltransferase
MPCPPNTNTATWRIVLDDLQGADIQALLAQHLDHMHSISPPESVHALDLAALRAPELSFWTLRQASDDQLLGCGALKALNAEHAEVKSMRTVDHARGRGVARAMLAHLVAAAKARGFQRLSLETGTEPAFEAARRLYAGAGFTECPPFADYVLDPHSVFMTLDLRCA